MKYVKKILLGITTICILMTAYIKPVSADSSWTAIDWANVRRNASLLSEGNEMSFTIVGSLIARRDEGPIVIKEDNCTLKFESYNSEKSVIMSDGYGFPLIIVEGDNVNIVFENVGVNGFRLDGDGGAIYVDGEHCTIQGGHFTGCYADTDGGAICLNEDYGVVKDCTFTSCDAGDDGGAIYVCAGADECIVKNCSFERCSCEERGNAVCGDNDTRVINCISNTENSYKLCKVENSTGSIMSQGNIIIITSILVVAIIVVVILVIRKRKHNKITSK